MNLNLFICAIIVAFVRSTEQLNHEERLHKYLFTCDNTVNCTIYNPNLRPVLTSSSKILVEARLGIKRIFEMDEQNQKVVLFAALLKKWKDQLLNWDPKDFGGIQFTYVKFSQIWTPKLELTSNRKYSMNKNSNHQEVYENYPVKLNYDGTVEFVPSLHLTSDCLFNYARYPFDVQYCNFVFQMPYDIKQVTLSMTSYYTKEYHLYDNIWTIDDFKNVGSIDQTTQNPFNILQVKFTRKVRNYLFTMPSYIIYIFTLLMFMLPQTSNQRIIIGSTCLIIASSLAYIMSNSLPHNDITAWPLLGKLYLFNIIMLTFSLVFSAFIIKIAHQDHLKTVPDWLKRFTLNFLARIFCIHAFAYAVFNAYKFNLQDNQNQSIHQDTMTNELIMSSIDDDFSITYRKAQRIDGEDDDERENELSIPNDDMSPYNKLTVEETVKKTKKPRSKVNKTIDQSSTKLALSKILKKIYNQLDQVGYVAQKENYKNCVNNEWLLIGSLVDRMLFFVYCSIVVMSTVTVLRN